MLVDILTRSMMPYFALITAPDFVTFIDAIWVLQPPRGDDFNDVAANPHDPPPLWYVIGKHVEALCVAHRLTTRQAQHLWTLFKYRTRGMNHTVIDALRDEIPRLLARDQHRRQQQHELVHANRSPKA